MVVVKVETGMEKAQIDFPKPPPKPMMTAQAQFENKMKEKTASECQAEQTKVVRERGEAFSLLKSRYQADNPDAFYEILATQKSANDKIAAMAAMENAKNLDGYVKSLPDIIEKKVADEARAKVPVDNGQSEMIGLGVGILAFVASFLLMAFGPAPPLFIGNVMVFLLASFLGYHLITEVKPSLYTPLMSMSNAISGIVIVGGMLQVQGKYLWPEIGTVTQILGAIAVAVAAVNISGGFAVTFRMLSMFKKAPSRPATQ